MESLLCWPVEQEESQNTGQNVNQGPDVWKMPKQGKYTFDQNFLLKIILNFNFLIFYS